MGETCNMGDKANVLKDSDPIGGVATYPFAGVRGEAHGCVFHGKKMRGVATNVY